MTIKQTIKQKASLYVEQGTRLTLIPPADRALQRLRSMGQRKNKDIHVLSGNDGDHDMGSIHFDDGAFDIDEAAFDSKQEVYTIVNNVGIEDKIYVQVPLASKTYEWVQVTHYFDVVKYPWGFHIEYQPSYIG